MFKVLPTGDPSCFESIALARGSCNDRGLGLSLRETAASGYVPFGSYAKPLDLFRGVVTQPLPAVSWLWDQLYWFDPVLGGRIGAGLAIFPVGVYIRRFGGKVILANCRSDQFTAAGCRAIPFAAGFDGYVPGHLAGFFDGGGLAAASWSGKQQLSGSFTGGVGMRCANWRINHCPPGLCTRVCLCSYTLFSSIGSVLATFWAEG